MAKVRLLATALCVCATSVGACSVSPGLDVGPSDYDLTDDELVADLGSPLPLDVDWQRTIEGVTVL